MRVTKMLSRLIQFITIFAGAATAPLMAQSADWHQRVDVALATGEVTPDDIYSVSLPRDDLTIMRDGHQLRSGMDFGSGINFKPMNGGVMAMGELVLTDDEVAPVLTRLERHGIEVNAVHKHVLKTSPSMIWIHVEAHGDPAVIAGQIKDALSVTGTPFPKRSAAPSGSNLPVAALSRTVGAKGKESGGVLQFRIPIAQGISEAGMQLPSAMGPQIEINMQSIGTNRSAATGEFPLTAAQVNPVVASMRQQGLEVVEVHNHMLHEEPRMFWVHFWGEDEPTRLAARLKVVIDTVPTKH